MDFKHYKLSNFFSIIKNIAKFLLPRKIFNTYRKLAIELLWIVVYSDKKKRYKNSDIYINSLKNLSGLEIGGPSWAWMTIMPIYRSIKKLDNIVIPSIENKEDSDLKKSDSRYTTGQIINVTSGWETATEGKNKFNWFLFNRGDIFFQDATNLDKINSESYNFVICSNVLEHLANPLKAINEFKRVIKKNGFIAIIVPYYKHTFDFKRPVTTINHLREDLINNVGEDDLTHLDEVIRFTDESDPVHNAQPNPNFNKREFAEHCKNNFYNRGMHHHVFDIDLLKSVAKEVDLKVIDINYFFNSCVMLTQKN
jgi:SAM-dependent methyltransferase